jgi:hypothetical protein
MFFFRKPLRVLAGTLAHLFRLTLADGAPKGGVSSSILYSVRVVKAQQPKPSALGLSSTPPASLNHASSPPRPSTLMFVLVPAQTRTCCSVYVANAACRVIIQLAQRRPPQQQLADLFDVDLAPRIFLQIMHVVQLATIHHAFAGGLRQRLGIVMCGLMQKCASPLSTHILRKNISSPEKDQWRQARARAWVSGTN